MPKRSGTNRDSHTTAHGGWTAEQLSQPEAIAGIPGPGRWLKLVYVPTGLFSLKISRATSTVGKTLLTPTFYAAKMALVDVALRDGLTQDADALVRHLSAADMRIGVPAEACVTGTIQKVRQETRAEDRKKNPDAPPYKPTIAMREVVHYRGTIALAFDLTTCPENLPELLTKIAPRINYFGKRGSFVQYARCERISNLDASFTQSINRLSGELPTLCHLAIMDDFGPEASFEALNSFSSLKIKRGAHRLFVETVVPLGIRNVGPGFVHYSSSNG